MRAFKGYVKTDTSEVEEYEFEVEEFADPHDVERAAVRAMWESGLVDLWWEEPIHGA